MNCAQNIEIANGILYPPIKNEIVAVTEPMAAPVILTKTDTEAHEWGFSYFQHASHHSRGYSPR